MPVQATNLMEAYTLATRNDSDWAAKKAKYLADREIVDQALAGLLPTINLNAQYGEQTFEGPNFDFIEDCTSLGIFSVIACLNNPPDGTSKQQSTHENYNLRITQPIYRRDRWYKYDASKSIEKSHQAELAYAQQELILKVSEGYFGVLRAQEELKISITEQKSLHTQLDEVKKRYKLGLSRDTDLFEVQASYDIAKAGRITAEGALEDIKEDLKLLTGQADIVVAPLPSDIPITPPKPALSKDWVDFANQNNYQVLAARFAVDSAKKQQKEKSSGYHPTLDFAIEHAKRIGNGGVSGDTETSIYGIQLTVPIFSGGIKASQARQAKHQHTEAKHKLEFARKNATRETRQFYNRVLTDISTLKAKGHAVRSHNSAHRSIKDGYESGLRTLTDVLTAEKKVYAARKEYTTARYDYILDSLRLKKSSGILTPKDIETLNGWLDGKVQNANMANDKDPLSLDNIDNIKITSERIIPLPEDEDKKPAHDTLFDAYKAWKEE